MNQRSTNVSAFGLLVNALTKKSDDGDTGEIFPLSDAKDLECGAQMIPRKVTDARRAGKKVIFSTKGEQHQWYWLMPDGSKIYNEV
ncbi:MAG: hypothetical protein PHE24_01875 [Patescibacteria group bacterium]|nr:hypothetical protein [Patescibacteria group bacterium]